MDALTCLQARHVLCLQARRLLCLQPRHLLRQQTRHLRSPKTSQLHCQHGRAVAVFATPLGCLGRPQMFCLLTQQMSCLQTQHASCLQTSQGIQEGDPWGSIFDNLGRRKRRAGGGRAVILDPVFLENVEQTTNSFIQFGSRSGFTSGSSGSTR